MVSSVDLEILPTRAPPPPRLPYLLTGPCLALPHTMVGRVSVYSLLVSLHDQPLLLCS